MWRFVLGIISAIYIGLALFMWFQPMAWYEATPGVAAMGPFNLHFIRDVALAYLVSGGAFIFALMKHDRTAAIFGAIWPCLHALFHLWIWVHRGVPFDEVAFVNFTAIQLPAWLGLFGASRYFQR